MQIRDQASGIFDAVRSNELLRRLEGANLISEREDQILEPASGPGIVVDNGDHGMLGQFNRPTHHPRRRTMPSCVWLSPFSESVINIDFSPVRYFPYY